MFKAILQEKVAGGGADEMDRETFCRWFVRYRGMKFFSDISLIIINIRENHFIFHLIAR